MKNLSTTHAHYMLDKTTDFNEGDRVTFRFRDTDYNLVFNSGKIKMTAPICIENLKKYEAEDESLKIEFVPGGQTLYVTTATI